MSVQISQLLVVNEDVPGEVRAAIAEGRLAEAGFLLMDGFGLTCQEASDLLGPDLCERAQ
ncbi:MAG TPA: hypothetical protein VNO33_05265 [Kofleriaceae bacterium]|nr:hypothetical protein [Kofleriaceae bacterium]